MDSDKSTQQIEVFNLEDINEYSNQLGWDSLYTQLAPGPFNGSYLDSTQGNVLVSSETLSVATTVKFAGITGYITLVIIMSDTLVTVNGLKLDSDAFFVLMPDAEVCVTTTGPATAQLAIFPESELEAELGEHYSAIKKYIKTTQVFSDNPAEDILGFKNWFQKWLKNPFTQDKLVQQNLSHQIYENVVASLNSIGAGLDKSSHASDRIFSGYANRPIADLIDYFHQHPNALMTTADMTKLTCMSRRNLFYQFKKYTGHSPHDFFRYLRLGYLRRELHAETADLTSLAYKYNFSHLGDFSALYRNTFGLTPAKDRKIRLATHRPVILP